MNKKNFILKSGVLVTLFLLSTAVNTALAQSTSSETGLCPGDFEEGLVMIGFVDCYDSSSLTSQRVDAEADRIELEAICLTAPNSEVTNSEILVHRSGRFFAEVTCTIQRFVPSGTVLCPADAEEVLRAFDTVVCQYFGMVERTMQEAVAIIAQQTAECTSLSGSVLDSSVTSIEVFGNIFYSTSLACALKTLVTDNIVCPFGFDEEFENDDELECEYSDRTFETLTEAEAASQKYQTICTTTTAGLGTVTEFQVGATSRPSFFATVVCSITKPRYSDFIDNVIIRACDATCTEDVEQIRFCLNGGIIGQPGCAEPSTQIVERVCNTGPDQNGLCPLPIAPATIIPLLLLDED